MSIKSKNIGLDSITHAQHQLASNSKKVTNPILIPGDVVTTDISSTPVLVGKGNIVRVRVTAMTYVAFGPSTIGVVSATTTPGLELPVAGTYLITATDEWIRASANPARIEVTNG